MLIHRIIPVFVLKVNPIKLGSHWEMKRGAIINWDFLFQLAMRQPDPYCPYYQIIYLWYLVVNNHL